MAANPKPTSRRAATTPSRSGPAEWVRAVIAAVAALAVCAVVVGESFGLARLPDGLWYLVLLVLLGLNAKADAVIRALIALLRD